jgi:hypothetical protein
MHKSTKLTSSWIGYAKYLNYSLANNSIYVRSGSWEGKYAFEGGDK